MSGQTPSAPPGTAPSGDPSMEDILASIRRILSDDEAKPEGDAEPPTTASASASAEEDDALVLNASMMVTESAPIAPSEPAVESPPVIPAPAPAPSATALVAPEAAAAAASSVDTLVRTLTTERGMLVTSQGPTIEDIVRQEIRPLLKAWLDVNLPPLVERLVRTEIERVVGRAAT